MKRNLLLALPICSLLIGASLPQDTPVVPIPRDPGHSRPGQVGELPAFGIAIELRRLQEEVGTWDAQIQSFIAPGMPPVTTQGVEVNRLLGDHWLLTDFTGVTFGEAYSGHGQTSFDSESGRAIGTWLDSRTNTLQELEGTYNLQRRERIFEFSVADKDGVESTYRWTKRTLDAEHRSFTIVSISSEGEELPIMTVDYTLIER